MTQLFVTDIMPEEHARRLASFNIRTAEQFLAATDNPENIGNVAAALDVEVSYIEALVKDVHANHPEIETPQPSGRKYPLGFIPS